MASILPKSLDLTHGSEIARPGCSLMSPGSVASLKEEPGEPFPSCQWTRRRAVPWREVPVSGAGYPVVVGTGARSVLGAVP